MLTVAFVAAACASARGNQSSTHAGLTAAQRAAMNWSNRQIQSYTKLVWHWDDVLGRPHMHFSYQPGSSTSLAYVRQFVLKKRVAVARRLHLQVKHVLAKRTKVHLAHISQLQMELGVKPASRQLAEAEGVEGLYNLASRLDKKLTKKWHKSPIYTGFMCIHSKEGSMTSVSHTNPPYYGGWQADITFQRQYGPEFLAKWGTADHWPAWAQLLAAVRAYRGWKGPDPRTLQARGFHPWPNTAVACGLL